MGRAKCVCMCIMCLAIIVGLHKVTGENGCPVIQDSCRDTCSCCQTCHDRKKPELNFCYYKGYPNYPKLCTKGTKNTICRCLKEDCDYLGPPPGQCNTIL